MNYKRLYTRLKLKIDSDLELNLTEDQQKNLKQTIVSSFIEEMHIENLESAKALNDLNEDVAMFHKLEEKTNNN